MTDKRMPGSAATIRQRAGHAFFLVALGVVAFAAIVMLSGGVAVRLGTVNVVSRTPLRALAVAGVLLLMARTLLGAASFAALVRRAAGSRDRRPARIAILLSGAAFVFAVAWNTRAAGGSDSSCYVLQAEAFAHGRVTLAAPLADLPPQLSPAAFAPTGFLPSLRTRGEAVPICGPGLALAMAVPFLVHPDAVFLVVPVTAASLVWFTFALGRLACDDRVGVSAAALLATSPIFLYQAVQPMSDVPAAAAWMAALTWTARGDRRGALYGGLAASMAVLMRANLALLVLPLFLLLLKNGDSPRFPDRKRGQVQFSAGAKRGLSPLLAFAAGITPGAIVMLALNVARYGSPLVSGYGDTGTLFAWAHVAPNLARYPRWLIETQTPLVVLACAAPWVVRTDGRRLRIVAVALIAVALLAATYLAYTVFDDWWYLRFLLPALPILLVCATTVLARLTAMVRGPLAGVALPVVVALLAGLSLDVARHRHAFDLRALESRFRVTGAYARGLGTGVVALAVQQSGSLRFHGGRATLAWDAIAPGDLDAVVAWLRASGREPLLILEDEEAQLFRRRFSSSGVGQLDWPPRAEVHTPVRVRVYDPVQRDAFLAGKLLETQHIWR